MRGFKMFVFLFFLSVTYEHAEGQMAADDPRTREPVNGIRIAWDYSTLKQLSPFNAKYSGYPRMIRLRDGTLFCVYESDRATYAIKSVDGGQQWSNAMIIAKPENNIARAVPDALQLHDGSILVSYNLRPPGNNDDPDKRFSIQVIRSKDGGQTWSKPIEV